MILFDWFKFSLLKIIALSSLRIVRVWNLKKIIDVPFQILGYYFVSPKTKYQALLNGIRQCIVQLKAIGFTIACIICDQEAMHQRIFRECCNNDNLLCYGDESIPVMSFDVPHLLKSTRNSVLKYKIKVSLVTSIYFCISENLTVTHCLKRYVILHIMLPFYFLQVGSQVIADASYVEKFQNVQGKHNLHLAPKLTNIHVTPNTRQRMRVKYAAQYLSHSVYSGKLESSYSLAFIISLILSLPKAKKLIELLNF